MRVLPMEEFHDKGWRYAAEEARRVVGGGPDLSVLRHRQPRPVEAPGTGTPEAGGITALEAQRLLRALRGIDFVGGDLVEVAPPFDVGTITAFNGASILFEILCLLAEAWRSGTADLPRQTQNCGAGGDRGRTAPAATTGTLAEEKPRQQEAQQDAGLPQRGDGGDRRLGHRPQHQRIGTNAGSRAAQPAHRLAQVRRDSGVERRSHSSVGTADSGNRHSV